MSVHSRHDDLTAAIGMEIADAMEVVENHRKDLADPARRGRWYGIWLGIESMVDCLFENEAKHLRTLDNGDWLAAANTHWLVMSFIGAMIDLCEANQIHRRANLDTVGDILLLLASHKARYDRRARPAPARGAPDHHPLQTCCAV